MIERLSRSLFAVAMVLAAATSAEAGNIKVDEMEAFTFAHIRFWVGSGANRAAFVVDWNDNDVTGPPLAWGYRWDGAATGEDMFRAIVAADRSLYAKISTPGSFGVSIYGMGYDRNRNGFSLDDGTVFDPITGIAVTGPSDGALSTDPADSYQEGWFTGFMGYYTGIDPYSGGTWTDATTGMRDRVLSDGTWDGFSFAPGFVFSVPSEPIAAVPERRRLRALPTARRTASTSSIDDVSFR